MEFDPNSAAVHDGLYGLPFAESDAHFVVVPVPFDATTSYRDGTRHGPAAVLEASFQVDLYDLDFGRPWERGIHLRPVARGEAARIAKLNAEARRYAKPVIAAGGDTAGRPKLVKALREVNRRSADMCVRVEQQAREILAAGKTPVVLGGDHSTPFGAIQAVAAAHPGLGILHVDAHADLRVAFEGFEWSHASIMYNVVSKIGARGGVAALVQVGIRDFGEDELELIRRPKGDGETRISTHFDARLRERLQRGERWPELCDAIVAELPGTIYVSVDIDGLDPKLCPDTGTPVPGGLDFAELAELLRAVVRGQRRIVGLDLNEVAPNRQLRKSGWGGDWNANVGARVLYKLIGAAAATR